MNGLVSNDSRTTGENPAVFTPAHLDALLGGALKTPKIIAGAERGVFDVNCDDVESFYYLIDQRINEQQSCGLDRFEVSIYFSNGASIRLNGIDEFKSYAQTQNIAPTVISFHWTLLINFPGQEIPEKQEIDITLRATGLPEEAMDISSSEHSVRMAGDKIQLIVGAESGGFGVIAYSINHTRITWGLDVENVIRSHISKVLQKPTKLDKYIDVALGFLNIFTTVFVGLYLANLLISLFFYFVFRSEDLDQQASIVDTASMYLVDGQIAKFIVASLVLAVLVFVLFSALVSAIIKSFRKPKPSFIVLSKFDENRKNVKLSKYNRRWVYITAVFSFNFIVATVIATVQGRISDFFTAIISN